MVSQAGRRPSDSWSSWPNASLHARTCQYQRAAELALPILPLLLVLLRIIHSFSFPFLVLTKDDHTYLYNSLCCSGFKEYSTHLSSFACNSRQWMGALITSFSNAQENDLPTELIKKEGKQTRTRTGVFKRQSLETKKPQNPKFQERRALGMLPPQGTKLLPHL